MEKKDSNRRRFFSKIAKLGLAGGIGALLLGRLGEKTFIPPVEATDMVIDAVNIGQATTELHSTITVEQGKAFLAKTTTTSGFTIGIEGASSSPEGIGVVGMASHASGLNGGVVGESLSNSGVGVLGRVFRNTGNTIGAKGWVTSNQGKGVYGLATADNGKTKGVLGESWSPDGTGVEALAGIADSIPLVAKGTWDQTANLQEWQKGDLGTVLSVVDKDGKLGIGTDEPGPMLDIVSGTTGPLNAASAPPGSAPNSFIAENLTSGNHKSQFTFRSNGANKWSFGNDVNGNGGQDFFFYDEVASTTPLRIDSSGVVHGNFQASDLSFTNGVRATEEGDGLAFKNPKGEKIAVLDSEGNLQVKGKITENPNL